MKHNTILHMVISAITIALLLTACGTNLTPTNPPSTNPSPTVAPTQVILPTAAPPTPDPMVTPPICGYHSMTYDAESKQIIIFGCQSGNPMQQSGRINGNETWSFDPSTQIWKKMSPKVAPGGFIGDMTYNARADRVILVLNTDPVTPNFFDYKTSQTWAYDFNTNTWTRLADGPSGRLGARVAYDSESDKVILFGGLTLPTGKVFNETWTYDFNTDTWIQMQPRVSPPPQNYQCMAYDSKADRVVNWGGETEGSLWTYDYNTDTWQNTKSENAPSAYYYCGFTYDDKANLFIFYGGSDAGTDETWTYDLNSNTWKQMQPTQTPGKLSRHELVYDPVTDRAILFGGQIEGRIFSYSAKAWLYDLNTNTWTNIAAEE